MKIKLYIFALLIFLAVDSLWLGLAGPAFYRSQIGFILAERPNLIAAGLFYLLFVLGVLVFVVDPGLKDHSRRRTLIRGAFFGLVAYGTYDLTNLATLEGWPVLVTVVDMAWGALLSAVVTLASVWAGKRFIKDD
jgi:uncharacterized membrane protein